VILEEAGFINPAMFYEVVVPLMSVSGTAVIGITTPNSGHNYFNELIALKDQYGRPLFLVLQFGQVCAACAKSGANCKHLLDSNPSWKPRERMAKVDAIMATNPQLRDQETRGVPASMNTILTEEQVKEYRARPRFRFLEGSPPVLFTAIDPFGGGDGSQFTIATLACLPGGIPVVSSNVTRN
jgi:hypothetical protein